MLKTLSNIQKALLFTCLTIIFSLVLTLLLPENVNIGVLMFVPVVVVLMMMLLTGEMFTKKGWVTLGLHQFSIKIFLIGAVVPIIPTLVGYVLVWNTGLGEFKVPAEAEGKFLLVIFGTIVSLIINSITKILGEEIGWRGYLLPKLQSIGIEKALFVSSFIWGLFHLAPILFSGQYHSDTNFLLFIPLFMLNVILAGVFIGYLRIISGSIWPAVIAHGMHNLTWAYGSMYTTNAEPIVTYLTGDVGILGVAFYFILYLIIRKKLHTSIEEKTYMTS